MFDESITDEIVKHLDTLEKVTGWGLLLALGIFLAGVVGSDKISIFGTTLRRRDSRLIVGVIYLAVTMFAGLLFLKIQYLFSRIEKAEEAAKAAEKMAHHTWILNPYASFARTNWLFEFLINHSGILLASAGWCTAIYSLCMFHGRGATGKALFRDSTLVVLLVSLAAGIILTLLAILRFYYFVLDPLEERLGQLTFDNTDAGKAARALNVRYLQALKELHGPVLESCVAIVLGLSLGGILSFWAWRAAETREFERQQRRRRVPSQRDASEGLAMAPAEPVQDPHEGAGVRGEVSQLQPEPLPGGEVQPGVHEPGAEAHRAEES
jgi:hypothetical protein